MLNKKTMITLLIALVLSAVGVFFAYGYIQDTIAQQTPKTAAIAPKKKEAMVNLVGLPRPTQQGTVLGDKHLSSIPVPVTVAEQHDYVYWEDMPEIIGRRLLVTLPRNSGLRYSDLADSSYLLFSDQLGIGERAMTIEADAFNSIFGYLQPQDRVDILLVTSGESGAASESITLTDNVLVLAADLTTQTDLTTPGLPNTGEISTVTLKVNKSQAQKIAVARKLGELVLILRNQQDFEVQSTPKETKQTLIPTIAPVEMIIGIAQ